MYEFKEFIESNKSFCIFFLFVAVFIVCGTWLLCDHWRNEPVYTDTNNAMADVEERIQSIEQRIDSLQSRVDKAQETVSGTIVTIRDSRENAAAVATGIDRAEERLDSIIQRQGRIENLIADIEAANRPGAKNTPAADMAK